MWEKQYLKEILISYLDFDLKVKNEQQVNKRGKVEIEFAK